MPSRKPPNQRLRSLIEEARWTGDAIAKAVNALGAESGLSLHYQRPSVAQWLNGGVPRPPIPNLIAEALSRRLGRLVTLQEIGFSGTDQNPASSLNSLVPDLILLGDPAHDVRGDAEAGVYSLSLLDRLSDEPWPAIMRPGQNRADRRIGTSELRAAELMLRVFSWADQNFGGGQIRPAIAAYISTSMAPWIKAPASSRVNQQMLSLAARMSYLCAFTHFDDQEHGRAQRYYLNGLRLAQSADDSVTASLIFRGLSVQAYTLGHRRRSLQLAETAVEYCRRSEVPPHVRAAVLAQHAVAKAAMGENRLAISQLLASEAELERTPDISTSIGSYNRSSLAHQRAEVTLLLKDLKTAETALDESIRFRSLAERRTLTLLLGKLAQLQLTQGHLELACSTWERFLQEYHHIHSSRADALHLTMRARLQSFRRNPVTAQVLSVATGRY